MHPDLLVHEGEEFDKYNWEECKLLRESPEIFAATLERARTYDPIIPFYNFTYFTSNGNEHLFEPDKNFEEATEAVNFMVTMLLGKGLDEARVMLYDFPDSAYHNYYGTDRTPVPDDSITLQLSK